MNTEMGVMLSSGRPNRRNDLVVLFLHPLVISIQVLLGRRAQGGGVVADDADAELPSRLAPLLAEAFLQGLSMPAAASFMLEDCHSCYHECNVTLNAGLHHFETSNL